MKAKLNTIAGIFAAGIMAVSCSAPKYASAQSDDGYYNNQPQPSAQDNQFDDQGATVDEQQDVDFNAFYSALSPYGTWENDPEYGEVWSNNDPSFVPYYTDGNWAYSNAGWAWVSDYNWGWAPFHYGRWAFRGHWVWVPGYEWAPAWVSWRTGGDYYGWAPLGPGISVGIGVGFGGYIAADRWNFCPRSYITSGHFNRYCVERSRNLTIIRNTTVINHINVYRNARFVAGPDRRDVERYTHTRINTMSIHNERRPGATVVHQGSIQMYRPNVRPGSGNHNPQQNHNNVPNQQHDFNQRQNRQQGEQPYNQQQQNNRQQQNNQPQQNRPGRQNQPPANNTQQRRTIHNTDRQQNGFNRNNTNQLTVPDRRMAYNNNHQQEPRPQAQQQHISQQHQQYQPRVEQQNRQPQYTRQQPREFSRQQGQQGNRQNSNSGDRQRGGRRG